MEQQNQQLIQENIENKSKAKTRWKLFAIVAIVAIILSVTGILLLKTMQSGSVVQTPSPAPPPQPQTLDISTWQTYRNEEFGFEVRYPEDWMVVEEYKYKGFWNSVSIVERTSMNLPRSFNILISKEEANYTAEDASRDFSKQAQKTEGLTIAGVPAVRTSRDTEELVFVVKNNREYRFFSSWDLENAPQESHTFDQILSTFRFLEKTTIPDVIPTNQQTCEEAGGTWQPAGAVRGYMCIFSYSDGGKQCQSSDECEGDCIIEVSTQEVGTCKKTTDPFGCFSMIEHYRAGYGILCRD